MPRNGSGTYNRAVSDYVFDTVISETTVNTEMDDLADALSDSLAKDGQTTPTANLPMGTYRHTGVGNASARDQYLTVDQYQDGETNWVDGGGTADAITAAYSPAITALVDGMFLGVRATAANATTAPTFSPNGLTARTIVKSGGDALVAGDIAGDGHELLLRYDLSNTRWELLNPVNPSSADVGGPASSTDNALPRFDGTGGKTLQTSSVVVDDSNNMSGVSNLTATGTPTLGGLAYPTSDGTNGQALVTNGSGTLSFASVGGSADATARSRINNLAFRLASLNSLAVFEMTDMVLDAFEDQTGVEVNNGATYDASGDYYTNAGTPTTDLIPTMTGSTTSGVTMSASISNTGGSNPWNAADDSKTAHWNGIGTSGILEIDWGSSTTIAGYTLNTGSGGGLSNPTGRAPNSWTLEAWNGSGWDVVDTQTGITFADDVTQTFVLASSSAATKHRINISANNGDGTYVAITEIELLQEEAANDVLLISDEYTADATPDTARATIWLDPVDAVTINTDAIAYASRAGAAFTTDYAADANEIADTAHGLSDDDRVSVFSTGTLPAGLSEGVLYYVVNSTTDAFELSTSSGGAAVTLTDDGTGTHTWAVFDAVTLAEDVAYDSDVTIYAADVDISGQPSGTAMRWAFATANNKEQRLHGVSLSWR